MIVYGNVLRRTPLIKAAYLRKAEILEWLLTFQENRDFIDFQDSKGRTAIHAACWGAKGGRIGKKVGGTIIPDSPECLRILLKYGARVSIYLSLISLD